MAAVDNHHFSRAMVASAGAFGFNIVGQRGKELEDYFYSARSRKPDNLEGLGYALSPTLKMPWLDLAMISIEARVVDSHRRGRPYAVHRGDGGSAHPRKGPTADIVGFGLCLCRRQGTLKR